MRRCRWRLQLSVASRVGGWISEVADSLSGCGQRRLRRPASQAVDGVGGCGCRRRLRTASPGVRGRTA
jgi:hypothetical protein